MHLGAYKVSKQIRQIQFNCDAREGGGVKMITERKCGQRSHCNSSHQADAFFYLQITFFHSLFTLVAENESIFSLFPAKSVVRLGIYSHFPQKYTKQFTIIGIY